MMSLSHSISTLRLKNYQGHPFIPRHALFDLLQQDTIIKALQPTTTPEQNLEELVGTVFRTGRLTFAILVSIGHPDYIMKFIEKDQFQAIDDKLPFNSESLGSILAGLPGVPAQMFYDAQWKFLAPVFLPFTLRRHLADGIILPFLDEKSIGQGAFGEVFDITIDPAHQKFDDSVHQLVRKDFKQRSQDFENSERELQNLSMLKLLQHPNINRLLGCYTYRKTHSLIFPKANGGDLWNFLRTPSRLAAFSSNSSFILALTGLSSALASVHNFVVKDLDLTRIGCYHDLKPGNVLVEEDQFTLADFGLARFKTAEEDSATMHQIRQGFFIAPECQAHDGTFEQHLARPSSDIWSLGCIMLEVVTYMLKGHVGVRDFEVKRRFFVDGVEYASFHEGNRRNEGVISWMQDLTDHPEAKGPEKLLLALIENMLQLDPESRPDAKVVEQCLIWISLLSLSNQILELFKILCSKPDFREVYTEAWIETMRFESWMRSLGFFDISFGDKLAPSKALDLGFETFRKLAHYLKTLQRELAELTSQKQDTQLRLILPLRRLNTTLCDHIPEAKKEKARQISEILILKNDHLKQLVNLKEDEASGLENITLLIQSKHDSHELQPNSSFVATPSINGRKLYKSRHKVGSHFLGYYLDESLNEKVIIDYKFYYDAHQREQLFPRMESLTKLYQSTLCHCESVGLLKCRGFFHDEDLGAFTLIYSFPSIPERESGLYNGDPFTLFDALESGYRRTPEEGRPTLKDRFKLAHNIATSLSTVHKIGWVHKGLTSSNVILFPQQERALVWKSTPFLVGLKHSRPCKGAFWTEGPSSDVDDVKYYQHPEYLKKNRSYFLHFDYYSLGVVLLEIGLGKCAVEIVNNSSFTLSEVRKKLQSRIPRLAHEMGTLYQSIVEACLGDSFLPVQFDREDQTHSECQFQFESRVLSKLSSLSSLEI